MVLAGAGRDPWTGRLIVCPWASLRAWVSPLIKLGSRLDSLGAWQAISKRILFGSCSVFHTFVIDAASIPNELGWAQWPFWRRGCTEKAH